MILLDDAVYVKGSVCNIWPAYLEKKKYILKNKQQTFQKVQRGFIQCRKNNDISHLFNECGVE